MSDYKDKGLIVDVVGLAPGGVVNSAWMDEASFVRELILLCTTNRDIEITLQRRDSDKIEESVCMNMITVPTSAVFGQFEGYQMGGAIGYSYRLKIKNLDGANNADIKIREQVIGN